MLWPFSTLSRSLDRACRFWENFRLPVDEGQGDPGRRLALDFGSNGAAGQLGRTRQALRPRTAVGSGPSDCCVLGDVTSFAPKTGLDKIGGQQRSVSASWRPPQLDQTENALALSAPNHS